MAEGSTLSGLDSWMAYITQGGAPRLCRLACPGLCHFSLSGKDPGDVVHGLPESSFSSLAAPLRGCAARTSSSFVRHSAAFWAQPWPGSAASQDS